MVLGVENPARDADEGEGQRDAHRECLDLLREEAFRSEKIGALECERWARAEDRREAASIAGRERRSSRESTASGMATSGGERERDRDLDREAERSGSSSLGVASSPSAPHPTPHATLSTLAMLQRRAIERSRHPSKILSAPLPMP